MVAYLGWEVEILQASGSGSSDPVLTALRLRPMALETDLAILLFLILLVGVREPPDLRAGY